MTADGGFLIADTYNSRVRQVSPAAVISTVAGNGMGGETGNGGPATSAELSNPSGVAVTADGGFLIVDSGDSTVRSVAPTNPCQSWIDQLEDLSPGDFETLAEYKQAVSYFLGQLKACERANGLSILP